jgi:hypothetical protein
VASAAHALAGIGHNGGPDAEALRLFELIGSRSVVAIVPFECGAPWTGYATEAELKRLGTLQARINRREQSLREMKAERRLIMNRNIRRMRRTDGKE